MDTNLVALITSLAAKHSSSNEFYILISILISSLVALFAAAAGLLQAKAAALHAAEAKVRATETNESVKQIHTAVNSERTAMLLELAKAKEEIVRLVGEKVIDFPKINLTDLQIETMIKRITENLKV